MFLYRSLAITFSLLLLTPLRVVVLPLMPFLFIAVVIIYSVYMNKNMIIVFILFSLASLYGILSGNTYLANVILSVWIVMPLLIMFTMAPLNIKMKKVSIIFSNYFFKYSLYLLIIIDFVGFIGRFIIFNSMDEFGVGYGRHFQYVSGLAMVNGFYLLFFLSKFIARKKLTTKDRFITLYLLSSFISCFSGLALICLVVALLSFYVVKFNFKQLVIVGLGSIIIIIGIFQVQSLKNTVVDYNQSNVKEFVEGSSTSYQNARKLLMFFNYYELVKSEPYQSIIGLGTGGYNSRIAFLLNNDSNNIFTTLFGNKMPKYHVQDAYSLWSTKFVSLESYNDGARNKPFSSIVSISAEMGILMALLILIIWLKRISKYLFKTKSNLLYTFLYLINVFLLLNFLVDQWLESSEFLLFIILQFSVIIINKYDSQNNSLLLVK